jgi:hypothetical protein
MCWRTVLGVSSTVAATCETVIRSAGHEYSGSSAAGAAASIIASSLT